MTSNDLLYAFKAFTEEAVKDLLLPVRLQKGDGEQPKDRAPAVYLMRLPDTKSAAKKAPYILHQKVTGTDEQTPGQRTRATVTIRSVFCVYDADEQAGGLSLNECMERVRIGILRERKLANRYALCMQAGESPQTMVYPDDTAPYYIGEMVTTWELPAVEREVKLHEQYQDNF